MTPRLILPVALLATLGACGGSEDADTAMTDDADGEAMVEATPGIIEPRIASGVALPEVPADILDPALRATKLACKMPIMPDQTDGRLLEGSTTDGTYRTAADPLLVAALHQEGARAANISIVTSGDAEEVRQEIDTHQMTRCRADIEALPGGGSQVTVRIAG